MYDRPLSFVNKHKLLFKYQFGFLWKNMARMLLLLYS